MPRTIQDAKLDTRGARGRLKKRREPHWRSMSEGVAIGYRKGSKGGTWIAKHYTPEHGRRFKSLGTADDILDADGVSILSFSQAQEAARDWFKELARQDAGGARRGPYTVSEAMTDYLTEYDRKGGKDRQRIDYAIKAHIGPKLGNRNLAELSVQDVRRWFSDLSKAPARVRTRKGQKQQYREADDSAEVIRRRRSTANRVLTILKAALNFAHDEGYSVGNDAWAKVKPFGEVDAPKVRFLTDQEAKRLVNACDDELRQIVIGALLTGCRYGELAAMKAGDYTPPFTGPKGETVAGNIHVEKSKSGKARHIALTDEGRQFFDDLTAGKASDDLLFTRKGGAWGHAQQTRPLKQASERAKINPAIGFHVLRHSYASRLAMRGVPMAVIAAQLGHSDTRMTERHYAHLAPSYVADTIRAAFDDMGLVPTSNVKPMRKKRRG